MYTYEQLKEVVRDCCSPFSINEIKKANNAVKRTCASQLVEMHKVDNEWETTMYYDFKIDDDFERIGFDFWNRRII